MPNAPSEWQIAHASVRGKSHIDGGLPNQDALHLLQSADGGCFALVVSDGAGSAPKAEAGAQHFSRAIARELLALVQAVTQGRFEGGSRNLVGDQLLRIVTQARQQLDPTGMRLKDYACNLMAVCMGPRWGLRVHLGDAVLLKSSFSATPEQRADYFVGTQMTAQERSEYANETHFITQADWTRHLLWDFLDPAGPEDLYALMTDGAADIALANVPNTTDRRVFRGFFAPLVAHVLRASPDRRNQVIADALASPQTYRLTGDDKTMALVIRTRAWGLASLDPAVDEPRTPASAPAVPRAAEAPPVVPLPTPETPPAASAPTSGSPPQAPPAAPRGSFHWIAFLALGVLLGAAAWPALKAGREQALAWQQGRAPELGRTPVPTAPAPTPEPRRPPAVPAPAPDAAPSVAVSGELSQDKEGPTARQSASAPVAAASSPARPASAPARPASGKAASAPKR